jgi:hypothetical protein
LAGNQPEGEKLDHRFVARVAQPVEEQDGKGQLVGGCQVFARFPDLARG